MDLKLNATFLKRLFSISMIIILSIVTYNRLEKLLKEETGLTQKFTENGISLPSLTICVRDFNEELNKKIETFDDYMKSFFDIRNIIDVGTYTDRGWHQMDFSNININLLPHLDNQSVWQNSYTYFKKSIKPCLTFNPPVQKLIYPQDAFIYFELNFTHLEYLSVEFHSKGQSKMNQKWEWTKVYGLFAKKWHHFALEGSIHKSVNTALRKCNEIPTSITKCYDDFYMTKLNCSFPWLNLPTNFKTCDHETKMKELEDLIVLANDPGSQIAKEIDAIGCNIPDCETVGWTILKFQKDEADRVNFKEFTEFFIPSSKEVQVIEEVLTYQLGDLFADFGGYTGILVGASVMTILDVILEILVKLKGSISKHTTRNATTKE